jgi:RecA/RadA recombinase
VNPTNSDPTNSGRWRVRGLRLVAAGDAGRWAAKPLGVPDTDPDVWGEGPRVSRRGRRMLVGLGVAEARHHVHVLGPTGTGKSTLLLRMVLAEAAAGRGVAVVDPHGDLALRILERLSGDCYGRLVVIDPDQTDAPVAWNVLDPSRVGAELVTEHLVATLHRLYAPWWGPRLEDTLRAACLTLTHPSNQQSVTGAGGVGAATLADIPRLLTDHRFRAAATAAVRRADPGGLGAFWDAYDALAPAQAAVVGGPVLSRLRAITGRRFALDLLGAAPSTLDLTQVLDGGILVARLPKGVLGEDTTRLVGSLLLTGLWQAATARTREAEAARLDATVVVDECHNFLHLPIGLDDALAEARSYRVSWVLAHQHLGQLPAGMAAAVDANARNKVYFTLSPGDARTLARHTAPHLDEHDLAGLDGFQIACRLMNGARPARPFTLATLPAPPAIPGGLSAACAAAAERGLPQQVRAEHAARRRLAATGSRPSPSGAGAHSLAHSAAHSLPHSLAHKQWAGEWATPDSVDPQVTPGTDDEGQVPD